MIAYPGTDGPVATPEHEAVREGIDGGKYAYLLETLIKKAKNNFGISQQDDENTRSWHIKVLTFKILCSNRHLDIFLRNFLYFPRFPGETVHVPRLGKIWNISLHFYTHGQFHFAKP